VEARLSVFFIGGTTLSLFFFSFWFPFLLTQLSVACLR
jgi:hypothetical protein